MYYIVELAELRVHTEKLYDSWKEYYDELRHPEHTVCHYGKTRA